MDTIDIDMGPLADVYKCLYIQFKRCANEQKKKIEKYKKKRQHIELYVSFMKRPQFTNIKRNGNKSLVFFPHYPIHTGQTGNGE